MKKHPTPSMTVEPGFRISPEAIQLIEAIQAELRLSDGAALANSIYHRAAVVHLVERCDRDKVRVARSLLTITHEVECLEQTLQELEAANPQDETLVMAVVERLEELREDLTIRQRAMEAFNSQEYQE